MIIIISEHFMQRVTEAVIC